MRRFTFEIAFFALVAWVGLAGGEPALEGTLDFVRPGAGAGMAFELVSGTNRCWIEMENAGGKSPALRSWLRAEKQTVPDWGHIQLLTGMMLPMARNAADLKRIGAAGQPARCVVDIMGQVLAVSDSGRFFAFKDGTGVILLEMPPPEQPVKAGPGDPHGGKLRD
jgi:hypothetical protein